MTTPIAALVRVMALAAWIIETVTSVMDSALRCGNANRSAARGDFAFAAPAALGCLFLALRGESTRATIFCSGVQTYRIGNVSEQVALGGSVLCTGVSAFSEAAPLV